MQEKAEEEGDCFCRSETGRCENSLVSTEQAEWMAPQV